MTTYTIRLVNCAFFARHGARAEEAVLGQRFFVDAELTVEAGSSPENDDLTGTVDYGAVFKLVETTVTGERFDLIEALALAIGRRLRTAFPQVSRAAITVRKPSAPVEGVFDYVAVTVAVL